MIYLKDLTQLYFNNIYEYFEYVLLSDYNGQHTQVNELIHDMSVAQRKDCVDYILNTHDDDSVNTARVIRKLNEY